MIENQLNGLRPERCPSILNIHERTLMSKTQVKTKTQTQKPPQAKPQGSTQGRTSNNVSKALEAVETAFDELYKALGPNNTPDPDKPTKSREDQRTEWDREDMAENDCLIKVHIQVMSKTKDVFTTKNSITVPALFSEDSVAEAPGRLSRQFKDQVTFPLLSSVQRYLENTHKPQKPLSEASSDEFMPREIEGSEDNEPLVTVDV